MARTSKVACLRVFIAHVTQNRCHVNRIDHELNCIKGGGACHLREKVLAEAAKTFVALSLLSPPHTPICLSFVVVADFRKNVDVLGTNVRCCPTHKNHLSHPPHPPSEKPGCLSKSSLSRTPRCCRTCTTSSDPRTRLCAWRSLKLDPSSPTTATSS
jgi:hypothetical protein